MNQVSVSVICNAYNQERYIARTLEGFVNQKTDFAFEVLIHDDASTDGTTEIIREYEKKYPEIIKPIYQSENQYSQGISPTKEFQIPRAKGKYIAICEGDDYWTDMEKLQKQFNALEQHTEVDICAHCAARVEAETEEVLSYVAPTNRECILSAEDVIRGGGAYVATNSLMYRRVLDEDIPLYRQKMMFDYTLQIQGSIRGGMMYLPECMAAYRWMTPGSWTKSIRDNTAKHRAVSKRLINMLHEVNEATNHQFSSAIEDRLLLEQITNLNTACQNIQILCKNWEPFKRQSLKIKIKLVIKACCPALIQLKQKIIR